MKLSDILKQIKVQTLVGWTVGYAAAIVLNALTGQHFDDKFWFCLGAVLVIRIITDLIFAFFEARKHPHTK